MKLRPKRALTGAPRRGAWVLLCAWLLAAPAFGAACDFGDRRLKAAGDDPHNWIMAGHDYSNRHFSGLEQIDADNVDRLAPRWIYQSGVTGSFQAEPIVADGTMFLTTYGDDVVKLDAATGKTLWRYRHKMRTAKVYGAPTSRGAAIGYGKVFAATIDGQVLALDCETGAVVWKKTVVHPEKGASESLALIDAGGAGRIQHGDSRLGYKMPPLVANGRLVVGVAGAGFDLHVADKPGGDVVNGGGSVIGMAGGYGRRGFLSAFDADTGDEVWRWYATKADGWESDFSATTPAGVPLHRDLDAERALAKKHRNAWRTGGGSLWLRPAYDPSRGLIYAGTGNPSPQNYGAGRPGDNLYTSGVAALRIGDGALDWFFQQVPHNIWGYEQAAPPFLFERDGRTRVGAASKDGWVYVNDAASGKLVAKSEPLVKFHNLFEPPTKQGTVIRPGPGGAVSWYPTSYDRHTGLAYVQVIHSSSVYTKRAAKKPGGKTIHYVKTTDAPNTPSWSTLDAVDLAHGGRIRWQKRTASRATGGTLATASGLVFAGQANGTFAAYDARTGEQLWHFNAGAGISGPPIAYTVGGVEYIAVAAGGVSLFKHTGPGVGDALIVFALGH